MSYYDGGGFLHGSVIGVKPCLVVAVYRAFDGGGGLGFHKTSTCFSLYNIYGYPKRFLQALFIELLSSSLGCNLKSKDGYSVIC
ncbi:hypothetical protein ACLB2K_010338 [Fragaria x ananassa]